MNKPTPQKIAIIGTGISGLGAAYLLHTSNDITVYEKNEYIGGHSRTIEVSSKEGNIPVDTGFIVFNKRNYPLLTRLFEHLQVPVTESDMSFGVSINQGWFEYGTKRPMDIFAQKRNLIRPAFWRMLFDILKFNRQATDFLSKAPDFTLGECLDQLGVGSWFKNYFVLAMGGAIWSTPLEEMLKFPACTFVRFFQNHGLLTVDEHPQWYTVRGGSREYVKKLIEPFKDRIRVNHAVAKVWREGSHVKVQSVGGETASYDTVIFACHADQALAMIADPCIEEKNILSAFSYQKNRVVLHSDTSLMPRNKNAWASWVYLSDDQVDRKKNVSLSYWMNNLQPLKTGLPIIATLNPGHEPNPELVHNEYIFEHPVFDTAAINAQARIDHIQGKNRLWFCGAYQRYGFHEDGLGSAVRMAERMGVLPQW